MFVYAAVAAAFLALGLGLVLWLLLAPGPRRARGYRRAQRLLDAGAWEPALAVVEGLSAGRHDASQAKLGRLAGEAHQYAGDVALKERRYEDSLSHLLAAAPALKVEPKEQRTRVVETMLAEARHLFAERAGDAASLSRLLQRTTALCASGEGGLAPAPCPEASFWQGLLHLREGQTDQALAALTLAHDQAGRQVIDPSLYLGMALHRLGRPQEALRYLAEANRVDGGCPFVTWQMGVSLVAAGGDSGLALRALQRALGPRGLPLWQSQPERVWVEAFPEGRSYVRRLALKHRYTCPVLGADLGVVIRQGQLALAQALYRQEKFAEAADLFGKLLQDSPPTPLLLRGYGLALARTGQYDQAYKHLRSALEQEEPKDPFTAGYLALCGALGKPTQPEDKPRNVAWAVALLSRFPLPGNAEWAGLLSAVHAEARSLGLAVATKDQALLCDVLASVDACDARAADAYRHLAVTAPDAVQPAHAWLYARAASALGAAGPGDLDLLGRAFADADSARAFFAKHQWDFDAVEYTLLERSAVQAPGRFPAALGPNYSARGEAFLLERSRAEEAAGRLDPARACAEVLLRLSPASLPGHDRLAAVHYRQGDKDRAVALLGGWHRLAPRDPWPLLREAVIEQERGNAARRAEAIDRALGLTEGRTRGAVAFLGARLALRQPSEEGSADALKDSLPLLETCLQEDPDHAEALWCLAAVRAALGDEPGLAAQAPRMDRPAVADARFHYLGAVCHLAAKEYGRAVELSRRAQEAAPAEASLTVECHYLAGLAHLHQDDAPAAKQALQKVAGADKSPSAVHARALLGQLSFHAGEYDDAIRWWSAVDPKARAGWQLDEPLRQTVLLAGLLAFGRGRYELAADRFREAGKLGLRDRRLGGLVTLALVRAGQRLLYGEVK